MDRQTAIDKIYDISNDLENLLYDLRREQDDFDIDEPAPDWEIWKTDVIKHLPKDCSAGLRMKIEEMLNNI